MTSLRDADPRTSRVPSVALRWFVLAIVYGAASTFAGAPGLTTGGAGVFGLLLGSVALAIPVTGQLSSPTCRMLIGYAVSSTMSALAFFQACYFEAGFRVLDHAGLQRVVADPIDFLYFFGVPGAGVVAYLRVGRVGAEFSWQVRTALLSIAIGLSILTASVVLGGRPLRFLLVKSASRSFEFAHLMLFLNPAVTMTLFWIDCAEKKVKVHTE